MTRKLTPTRHKRKPLDVRWPDEDLEHLGKCPICGSRERNIIFNNLQDKTFFCAPGIWTLWRCRPCNVGYLDPRPTESSISRAYNHYYTHNVSKDSVVSRTIQKLQIGIRHSYLNKNFGFNLRKTLALGWLAYVILPSQAAITENTIRHLPSPARKLPRLLDIGCGNGDFLEIAQNLGYDVEGLEIDPQACSVALKKGIKVHEGRLQGCGLPLNQFDQITMCHVLEHFHDPRAALAEVFNLLRPNGRVWIQVPNLAATSLQRFGQNSRLLEPPRHLVMFDPQSLRSILEEQGFKNVRFQSTKNFNFHNYIINQSWMIEQGFDPYKTPLSIVPKEVKRDSLSAYQALNKEFESAEIITATGTKF